MLADYILQPEAKKITDFTFEKFAKFKPHSVILQKKFTNYSYDENGVQSVVKFTQTNSNSLVNLEKGASGQYNGYMSPATRRKVKGIIENYLTAVQLSTSMAFPKSFPSTEVYPTFLTLTLPGKQLHDDNLIKEYFGRFMEYLTGSKERGNSGWNVKNYIWVAETQKNGNIHFHVILDRALPAKRIQQEWNRVLERLSYVTWFRNRQNFIYKHGFYVRKSMLDHAVDKARAHAKKTSQKFDVKAARDLEKKRQKEAYERGMASNWNNPPTTKIHAIHNIKKLTAYVSKYMTKEPEMVNVALQPGEKLIQENGHYFIESETIEKSISIEGHELETVEHDRRPIVVKFTNRYLRGRIWGSSKALHSDNLTPLTITLESVSKVTTTTYKPHVLKINEPRYTMNIFGENEFTHFEKVERVRFDTVIVTDLATPVYDQQAKNWVEFLKEEHVPAADIEKATARAGEHFSRFGGEIIPLEAPQKDLLKNFAPEFHTRYVEYYQSMFSNLYPATHE
jgi:hypothetical protein